MRKVILLAGLVIGCGALAGALDIEVPAERELQHVIEEGGNVPLGDLTVDQLLEVARLAAVAEAQREHVEKAAWQSVFVPGLGQYLNGAVGPGIGFFAADFTIAGTAAVVGYLLLPAAVQFANLNYLQSQITDIETRWKSLTPGELIPAIAVGFSAAVLRAIVRSAAARDARSRALTAIEEGRVTVQPVLRVPGMARSR